jgi:hypothetical protein
MAPTAVNGASSEHQHGVVGRPPARAAATPPVDLDTARASLRLALPEPGSKYSQDDEWCVVAEPDGSWGEYRFHDYDRIFRVPGLYEKNYYDVLA